MIPTIPQLGWEVYKEKQEVMPGITKGHFPFDWNEYFNGPRSAMRPGGGRGRQSVSRIKPTTCGLPVTSKPVKYQVTLGEVPILWSNTTEWGLYHRSLLFHPLYQVRKGPAASCLSLLSRNQHFLSSITFTILFWPRMLCCTELKCTVPGALGGFANSAGYFFLLPSTWPLALGCSTLHGYYAPGLTDVPQISQTCSYLRAFGLGCCLWPEMLSCLVFMSPTPSFIQTPPK